MPLRHRLAASCRRRSALPHLRLGRRRQVDADRPAALRAEPDLRRSVRQRSSAISKKHGTTGEEIDFALLLDGLEAEREQGITIDVAYRYFSTHAARLHRRRHARPRAIHPQHGDRRLQCRSRRPAGRCAQGPADPDPPPRHHRVAARHPPRRAGGQQDRSGRLRPGRSSTRIVADFLEFASATLGFDDRSCRFRFRRATATMSPRASSANALVQGAAPPELISKQVDVEQATAGTSASVPGAVGQPPRSRFSRLCRNDRLRADRAGRRDRRRRLGRTDAGSRASSTMDGDLEARRGAAMPSPWRSPTRSTSRAATCCAIRSNRPAGRRPVRGASDLDERGAAVAGPLLPDEDRQRRSFAASGHRDQAQARRQHAGAGSRPRRSHLNEIGLCNLALVEADRLRRLCRQPRHRRLHPDRPRHQRDRGGGHDRLRAAARHQRASPGADARARPSARTEAPEARRFSGSPACRAPANRPSPTSSKPGCCSAAPTPSCWMATMCATA